MSRKHLTTVADKPNHIPSLLPDGDAFRSNVRGRVAPIRRFGRALGGVLLVLGLLTQTSFGQTSSAVPLSSNRWLLVVETSHAMAARSQAVEQIAAWMVSSGMNGQMRAGDTLGLWTFDTKLYDGRFPLQQWRPATARAIASRVYQYLLNQKFENQGQLDRVMPALGKVIGNSAFITVVLITDGLEGLHGTPFDDKLNASYEAWRSEQERKQMPFVTLLRGQHGRITSYVVNTPPWPLQLLAPPPAPPAAKKLKPKIVTAPRKVPTRVLPPLIIHGSEKAGKQSASKPVAEAAVPSASVTSNEPANETSPQTAVNTPSTRNTPQAGQGSVSEPTPLPQTAVKAAETVTELPGKTKSASSHPEPKPARTLNGSITPPTSPSKGEEAPNAGAGAVQENKARAAAGTSVAGPVKSKPEPPPAAHESTARKAGSATATNERVLAKTTNSPVEVGQAIPPTTLFHRSLVWVGLLVFVVIVFVVILLRIRRARSSDRISLITRSLDHDK